MSKRKKKTKEIEYAVRYLHDTLKMASIDISLELGIEQAIVDGIINQTPEPTQQKISKTQNLMIRHSAGKKINNVSIMTEAASQLSDELKKNTPSTSSRTSKNAIYRPNG
jgi:hypothetical protein